jgi:hypothetical protein
MSLLVDQREWRSGAGMGCRWQVLLGFRRPSTAAHDTKPTREAPDRLTENEFEPS